MLIKLTYFLLRKKKQFHVSKTVFKSNKYSVIVHVDVSRQLEAEIVNS